MAFIVAAGNAPAQTYTYTDGENNSSALAPTTTASLTIASGTATQSGSVNATGFYLYKTGSGEIDLTNTTAAGDAVVDFGTLGVQGAGASITTQSAYVGYVSGDTGTLAISNGGQVASVNGLVIGLNTGSAGAVTVSGVNNGVASSLTGSGATSEITVGEFGVGSLSILNGGQASANQSIVGLVSGGSGTVTVSGSSGGIASTWSTAGGVLVGGGGAGTVIVQNGGVVQSGGGTGTIQLAYVGGSSGTLIIGNGATSGVVNAGQIQGGSGSAQVIFNETDTDTFSPVLTGALGVFQSGTGTTVLTGANTYTGTTTVSSGVLQLSGAGILGSGTLTTTGSGAVDLNGTNQTVTALTGSGGVVLNNAGGTTSTLTTGYNGGTGTYAGAIENGNGIVALTKTGAGEETLTGSSAYTGATIVSGGTLQLTGTLSGSTVVVTGAIPNDYVVDGVFLESSTGVIGGAAGFTQDSTTSTSILSGANTYTGTTTVLAGTLNLGGGGTTGSIGSNSTLSVGGSGTFTYDETGGASQAFNGLNVTTGLGSVTNAVAGSTLNLGAITRSGGGIVEFTATGSITASSANTDGIIGPWAVIGTGTTLAYAVANGAGNTITALSGTQDNSGTLASVTNPAGDYTTSFSTPSGTITDNGGVTANTLQFTGSVNGWSTQGATLNGLMNSTFGQFQETGAAITIGANRELDIVTNSNGMTIGSAIVDNSAGSSSLVVATIGGGGQGITLNGANTYTGATYLDSGYLTLGGSLDGGNYAGTIYDNGTFGYTASATQTLSGSVTGTGNLTNSGNLTLTGSTTLGGAITASAGTLAVQGPAGNIDNANVTITASNSGTFSVAGGAQVTAYTLNVNGTYGAGSNAIVSGASAVGTASTVTAEYIDVGVGAASSGTLTIQNGGQVANTWGSIGVNGLGTGTVIVNGINADGTASMFSNSLYLQVGIYEGSGTLIVQNGGIVQVAGGTGTVQLAFNSGGPFSSGSLIIGNGAQAGTVQAVGVSGGGGVAKVVFSETDSTYTFAPTLTGSLTVTQSGPGTTILTGTNSYLGGTTVSGGTLTAANASALGASTNFLAVGNSNTGAGTSVALNLANTATTTVGSLSGSLATPGSGTNSATINITSGNNLTVNQTTNATYAGSIAGAGSSFTLGSGSNATLVLSGANSYTGPTTIAAGTLEFATENSLYGGAGSHWSPANLVVNSGATLAFAVGGAGQFTSSDLSTILSNLAASTATTGLENGSSIGIDTGTINFTLSAAIANTNSGANVVGLVKQGKSTLILAGANTYTGSTIIYGGSVQLSGAGKLGSGSLGLSGGTAVDLNGTSQAVGALIGVTGSLTGYGDVINNDAGTTSTLTIGNGNASGSYSGALVNGASGSGTLALTKIGTGTEILSGPNTYTGVTSINGGTLEALSTSSALGNGGNITFGGGTLEYGTSLTTDFSSRIVNSSSAISINPNGQTITFASGLASTNTGGLTMAGTGTLNLDGANAYTGTTTIDMGTVVVGGTGSLNSASVLSVGGSGVFSYTDFNNATQNLAGLNVTTGVGTVNNTAAGSHLNLGPITRSGGGMLDFGAMTGTITTTTPDFNGIIGPWAFTGTGSSLSYAVANGVSPITSLVGTTATAGTLSNLTAGGNFVYSGAAATSTIALSANTLKYTGGASTTNLGGTALSLNGLMNSGSGLLTITGNPGATNLRIATAGELDVISDAAGITIATGIGGNGTLVYGGPVGGTGTLTLSGTNNYTGGTIINAGTVVAASSAALGSPTSSLTLASSGTLDLDGHSIQADALNGSGGTVTDGTFVPSTLILGTGVASTATFTGVIQNGNGVVALEKTGAGTQILGGASTYSGPTTVQNGILLLQNGTNGSATGSGSLYVSTAGTIGGAGTSNSSSFSINGKVIVGNGTDVTSQTTLTATSSSSINNALLTFNLGTGTSAGQSNTLNLGATPITFSGDELQLNLVGTTPITLGTAYTLITMSSPINAAADGLTVGPDGHITGGLGILSTGVFGAGGTYDDSYLFINGDSIDLVVVPEPSAWALLLGGVSLLVLWRRRSIRA